MANQTNRFQAFMNTKGRTLITIVILILILGGTSSGFTYLLSLKPAPESREERELVYKVTVYDANARNVQRIISAFGTAEADREVMISAQVAGEVVETNPRLEVGETMSAQGESERIPGDLLLRIDPTSYEQRVTQAESRLAEDRAEIARLGKEEINQKEVLTKAAADLKVYREQFERIKNLKTKGVATSADLDQAQLELQRYETLLIRAQNENKLFPLRQAQLAMRLETHQQDLKLAKHDLQRTEVRVPFDGVLSEVTVEQGEYVNVGKQMMKLVDVSVVDIPVSITMEDYSILKGLMNNNVLPTVELAENETAPTRWYGKVVRISPVMDQQTRTVKVFVRVENKDQTVPLLPGTFVNARIEGKVFNDIIVVPRDSIQNGRLFVASKKPVPRSKPTESEQASETQTGETETAAAEVDIYSVESREVTVGKTLQSLAVITEGLKPDEVVIMSNLDVIFDGAKIEIFDRRNLTDEIKTHRIRAAREVNSTPNSPASQAKRE